MVSVDCSTRIGIKEVAALLGVDNSFGPFFNTFTTYRINTGSIAT